MVPPLAVAVVFKDSGMVLASLALAGAFYLSHARARAVCVLVAFVLSPVLLVGELWNTSQVHDLRAHPAELLALCVVGAGLIVALAALFLRRPVLLPVLAVAALPFRIPVAAGGQSALLLVPLYVVVGGGSLAYVWERLRGPRHASDNGYRFAPAEREPGLVELALLLAVTLYSIQAAYSTDFETAVKNVAFFYIPFALLLKLLTSLDWTARLHDLVHARAGGSRGAVRARGLLGVPRPPAALEPEGDRVESVPVLLPSQLAVLRPEHLRPLPRDGHGGPGGAAVVEHPTAGDPRVRGTARAPVGGLVLSFSQSSIAALLVGLAVLAAVRWRAKPVIAVLAAGLVAAAIVVFAAPGSIHLRGHSAKSLNHATSGRFNLMKGGLRMFADRPVYGYGAGSFAERFRAREKKSEAQAASASHTIPITVAAEQGVVGLGVYVFLLVVSFRLLFGGLLELRGPGPPSARMLGRVVAAAAFSALAFHTLLYADFLEDPLTWTLLGLGIALRRGPPVAERVQSGSYSVTPAAASTSSQES